MAPKEKDCRNQTSLKAMVRRRSNSKSPTTLGDLPDKLLEHILRRLASPVWFVRAAATCKRWRRVVTNNNFPFHMDRLLVPNPVAGHYHSRRRPDGRGRQLTFVPSSSAAALGVDARRHFSLDFLPGGGSSWELMDSHGSLLLLAATSSTRRRRRCFFPDLVVCEPVTRRYKLIPRMEEMKYQCCLGVFLQGYTTSSSIMSSFRVICVVYMEYNGVSDGLGTVRACVFNPNGSNSWKPRPRSACWYMFKPTWNMARRGIHLRGSEYVRFLGHAAGAVFWAVAGDDTLLVLDKWRTEFEVLRLPDSVRGSSELRAIVDGGGNGDNDGKLRVVCLDEENVVRVFATWRGQYSNGEWVLQKSLRLAESTMGLAGYKAGYFRSGAAMVVTASAGSVVLTPMEEMTWMFSVDLETMEIAECKEVSMAVYPCELPWRPTLRACVMRCQRRGQGRCSHICICDDA
uniref:F-box domain-containing protein n=1 Tax=Oryza punctata TaxID=4537 RepID=A0A0E0M034_ORYPU